MKKRKIIIIALITIIFLSIGCFVFNLIRLEEPDYNGGELLFEIDEPIIADNHKSNLNDTYEFIKKYTDKHHPNAKINNAQIILSETNSIQTLFLEMVSPKNNNQDYIGMFFVEFDFNKQEISKFTYYKLEKQPFIFFDFINIENIEELMKNISLPEKNGFEKDENVLYKIDFWIEDSSLIVTNIATGNSEHYKLKKSFWKYSIR